MTDVINAPDRHGFLPHADPALDGTERGDSWKTVADALNTKFSALDSRNAANEADIIGRSVYYPFEPAEVDATALPTLPGVVPLSVSTFAPSGTRYYFTGIFSPTYDISVTDIQALASVAGDAGSTVRFAIYECGADLLPDTLVVDGGTAVAADTTGPQKQTLASPVTLSAGHLYTIALVVSVGTSTYPTYRALVTSAPGLPVSNSGNALFFYDYVLSDTGKSAGTAYPADTSGLTLTHGTSATIPLYHFIGLIYTAA